MPDAAPRSLLFVPADRAGRLLAGALRSGADGVILDLEDAVGPEAKELARREMRSALTQVDGTPGSGAPSMYVRINPMPSPWYSDDLAAIADADLSGIMLAKVEAADAVRLLAAATRRELRIVPLIESPAGLLAAGEIARADARVVGLAFGAEDFSATLPVPDATLQVGHARLHLVMAAAAAGRWALDSPTLHTDDVETIGRLARRSRRYGFSGKLLIHPTQVAPTHAAFRPTAGELAHARGVVESFEEMAARGVAVAQVDGLMVDAAVAAAARRLLQRADNHEG